MLLRSQRNSVLQLVKNLELDPFNFRWSEKPSMLMVIDGSNAVVSRLSYNDTDFYFQFDFKDGMHYAIFSPGRETLVEEQFAGSWHVQLSSVHNWLNYLKREIEQPDLWDELAKYQLPPGEQINKQIGNEPFTAQQVDQIAENLKKLHVYLEDEFHLDIEQKAVVNEKMDYLMEASRRQGRKDWLHTSIGVMFTLAMFLAASPEQTKMIWSILKAAVSGVIQLLP